MADLMAEYIDTGTFKLTGDLTSEFSLYRRVKADCGTDGCFYSCVGTSSYDSGTNKTTVTLLDAVLTSNLSKVWFGVVGMGDQGAFPETGAFKRVLPQDVQLIQNGGMERGNKSLSLNTGHYTDWTGAASNYSVTAGYMAYAHTYPGGYGGVAIGKWAGGIGSGVAVGLYANAYHKSVSVGENANGSSEKYVVSVGADSYADYKGTGIGAKAAVGPKCASMGYGSTATEKSVSAGYKAQVKYPGHGVALGHYAYVPQGYAISMGYKAKITAKYTACLAGAICTRNTANASGKNVLMDFSAAEITIMSGIVDLTVTGDTEIVLPEEPDDMYESGIKFFPTEVGVIVTEADSVTGQPSLSFGEGAASPDTLSASAQTTGLDAAGTRERRDTLDKYDSVIDALSGTVTTAATATTLKCRFYFKGFIVENEQ